MAFHYKDNWFFERLEDGSVRISHVEDGQTVECDVVLDIDPDSWASIVASVSLSGENPHTFKRAQELHQKGNIKGPEPDKDRVVR